ncbi:MAG: HAMP domain-containing histidine kinase [Planctomycetes bacterium]|nr:HAMP domain-containing histidine kinase [Planctomycetota bacterium]
MAGTRKAWIVSGSVATAVLVVALLGTRELIRLDRRERDQAAQSAHDQQLRSALWRLDGALGAFVARQWGQCLPDRVTGASRPSALVPDYIRSYVVEDENGCLVAWPGRPRREGVDFVGLEGPRIEAQALTDNPSYAGPEQVLGENSADLGTDFNLQNNDLAPRARSNVNFMAQQLGSPLNRADLTPVLALVAPLSGVWTGANPTELLLLRPALEPYEPHARRVGVWLDWPALENWMAAEIRDLLPAARFAPALRDESGAASGRLASIPVQVVSEGPAGATLALGRQDLPILAAWVALLASLGGMAFFVHRTLSLSERRARFVSAVTHELRTPLTTFRLYAQMLEDGMVPEERKPEYLATLGTESERLARVVESVLLWSKLERGAGKSRCERLKVSALVDRVLPALARRVAASSQDWKPTIDLPEGLLVEVDPQAFEQVLFNLVDNAVKYGAREGAIRLEASIKDDALQVTIDDDGPGVAGSDRKSIFEPFRRAHCHQSGSQPGLGLGLPLARDLIRAQGGDLRHLRGSRFVVQLPLFVRA